MEKIFCHKCGLENSKSNNYCTEDGSSMNKSISSKVSIRNEVENKCSRCSNENSSHANYCRSCGNRLHYIFTRDKSIQKNYTKESSESIQKVTQSSKKISINLSNLNYMNILLIPIIAIGLTSICSTIFKQILLVAIESEFLYEEYIIFKSLLDNINSLLILNLSPIKLYGNAWNMGDISGTINLGLIGICILPIIIITITNLVFSKYKQDKKSNILGDSIISAIIYSCILFFIATISKKSVAVEGVTIGLQYSLGGLFIKSFILYLIPTLVVNIMKNCKHEINYLNIFNKCILIISIQAFIFMFIMFIAIASEVSANDSFISISMLFSLMVIPFMMPIIGVVSFIPTSINGYSISLFKFKEMMEYMEYGYILSEFEYVTFGIVLMAIVLLISLFFVGRSLKSTYRENSLRPVLIFSLLYSVVMGACMYISKITFTEDVSMLGIYNNGNVYIGSSCIAAIIVGFSYSFMISFLGYKSKRI